MLIPLAASRHQIGSVHRVAAATIEYVGLPVWLVSRPANHEKVDAGITSDLQTDRGTEPAAS